jgi:hypothetical protein
MVSVMSQPLYPPSESCPWFESKLNPTRLEYSLYIYFEHVLRNAVSKPNCEVSVLSIKSIMRAVYCSSLEFSMLFSFRGLWPVFDCYQTVALKGAVYHRGKEKQLSASRHPFVLQENLPRDCKRK